MSILVACLLLFAACATPAGVRQVGIRETQEHLNTSYLTHDRVSSATQVVLHRYGLTRDFAKDPDGTIRRLHDIACSDDRDDVVYALSELCYARGELCRRGPKAWLKPRAPEFYLASAVYAYEFLTRAATNPTRRWVDRRILAATGFYNLGLTRALAVTPDATRITIEDGVRALPVGSLQLTVDRTNFPYDLATFSAFKPADGLLVRGLKVRLRDDGLGVPLVCVEGKTNTRSVTPVLPATLLLDVGKPLADFAGRPVPAKLELFATFEYTQAKAGPLTVPLQTDLTAPLAYSMQSSPLWDLGLQQFLSGIERFKSGIYPTQPYQRGAIPVVFVHGTASQPLWWAEMWNTLRADPELRRRYQFWVFIYNTGNPITYSADLLRQALAAKIAECRQQGDDPALDQTVVIGHSQGGLLAKLTATDTGDALWRAVSATPFESVSLPPAQREEIHRLFYFQPLPFVRQVVFICTPHRGSYLVGGFALWLAHKLIGLPNTLTQLGEQTLTVWSSSSLPAHLRGKIPTSIDSMSPQNPVLLALAKLPVASGVSAFSIMALKDAAGVQAINAGHTNLTARITSGDGVVKYQSAHLDGVPEYAVLDGHSCQSNPFVIERVRGILIDHLTSLTASRPNDSRPTPEVRDP